MGNLLVFLHLLR